MTRALVLGASGQVAQDLPAALTAQGFTDVTRIGRETADLSNADANSLLKQYAPDVVINAAAYTAVDRAEHEREAAFALNGDMPGRFARAAAARGLPFVHISTDYVFDGTKDGAYVESDARRPLGVYGASKALGEDEVAAAGGRTAVLRTAWVYGPHGANFMKTMIRLAETRHEVGVVADQMGCPTPSADVAEGSARVARALADGTLNGGQLFHCAAAGEAAWADFAEAIFQARRDRGLRHAEVKRITTADFPTPAQRPSNSRLDSTALETAIGWRPTHWREGLGRIAAAWADPVASG